MYGPIKSKSQHPNNTKHPLGNKGELDLLSSLLYFRTILEHVSKLQWRIQDFQETPPRQRDPILSFSHTKSAHVGHWHSTNGVGAQPPPPKGNPGPATESY